MDEHPAQNNWSLNIETLVMESSYKFYKEK